MRPNFNILWVDDQDISADKALLSPKIEEHGFRLKVKIAENLGKLDEIIKDDLYGDNIDLIIIDYDLGDDKFGIDGIESIREKWPYKELIFYSARQSTDLIRKAKERDLQFVVCCDKERIEETTLGVFENMTRRQLDLSHSRGIIIEIACDIDNLTWQSIKFLVVKGYDNKKHFNRKLSFIINEQKQSKSKKEGAQRALDKSQASEGDFDNFLNTFFSNNIFVQSSIILKVLEEILNDMGEKDRYSQVKNFRYKCLKERNLLAHGRVEQSDDFQTRLHRYDGTEVSMEDMKSLRRRGIEQLTLFEDLVDWAKDLPQKS